MAHLPSRSVQGPASAWRCSPVVDRTWRPRAAAAPSRSTRPPTGNPIPTGAERLPADPAAAIETRRVPDGSADAPPRRRRPRAGRPTRTTTSRDAADGAGRTSEQLQRRGQQHEHERRADHAVGRLATTVARPDVHGRKRSDQDRGREAELEIAHEDVRERRGCTERHRLHQIRAHQLRTAQLAGR